MRGGKIISDISFCGFGSPNVRRYPYPNVNHCNMNLSLTKHAEIGAINSLNHGSMRLRLLKKSTLIVLRFKMIESNSNSNLNSNSKNKNSSMKMKMKMNTSTNANDNDDYEFACSRPCSQCLKIIANLQFRNVIYCDENGNLVNEKVKEIVSKAKPSGGTLRMLDQL